MTTPIFIAAIAALFIAGCGDNTSGATARAPATVDAATAETDSGKAMESGATIEPPLLADEIADDRDPYGTDEAGSSTEAEEPSIDVLADDVGDVKYTPVATTSLAVTAEDVRYVQQIEQRSSLAVNPEPASSSTLNADAPAAPGETAQTKQQTDAATVSAAPPTSVDEKQILKDKNGQWAVSAKASSTYAQSPGNKAPYSAWQATNAPNVSRYADDGAAWASKSGDAKQPEWLEVTFARPVHATSIRIRQNTAPGAISGIELIDEDGQTHPLWSGTDDTAYAKNTIGWLIKDVPRTQFKVRGARITLQTARVWGWNEIDAVQLVGEP